MISYDFIIFHQCLRLPVAAGLCANRSAASSKHVPIQVCISCHCPFGGIGLGTCVCIYVICSICRSWELVLGGLTSDMSANLLIRKTWFCTCTPERTNRSRSLNDSEKGESKAIRAFSSIIQFRGHHRFPAYDSMLVERLDA